jgi:hypothetical protein
MFSAKPVAQPGRQFQTGRSAADDDDVMCLGHVASAFSAVWAVDELYACAGTLIEVGEPEIFPSIAQINGINRWHL